MEKDSKPASGGWPGNGVVMLLLVAMGAFFLREAPLEGSRPAANEPRLEQRFGEQDIDARLWQDPFGAVARARDAAIRKHGMDSVRADEAKSRAAKTLADSIKLKTTAGSAREVVVLAVMLAGGPYAEAVESRRRTRYAVLAALNAGKFVPADSEHIAYFLPADGAGPSRDLPETVPYEWFEPASDSKKNDADCDACSVLVLWLDSGAFYEQPFERLRRLMAALCPAENRAARDAALRWQVLGPFGSDGLKAMVDEVAAPHYLPPQFPGRHVRFYSPSATVPDSVMLGEAGGAKDLVAYFGQHGIDFIRTIGTDGRVARGLIGELTLRGLKARALAPHHNGDDPRPETYREICRATGPAADAPSHIAVVGEWDTMYGRSLRREFKPSDGESGFCVSRFSYVRGLDGQMPEQGSDPAASTGGDNAKAAKSDNRRQDGSFIERAEGQSQFDYLRRLAAQLRALDGELQRRRADGDGIRAIGVLGNDVHDKLLVLQALQPEFPNAIFFTTDLDARFMHPRETAWTRNLIVASSFGLRLADGLQSGTPPFRDSYQSATFFAAWLAIDEARPGGRPRAQGQIDGLFERPRIFEIGRASAFDFSRPAEGAPGRAAALPCRGVALNECDLHPAPSQPYPSPSPALLALCASALVLALWAPLLLLSRGGRRRLRRFVARGISARGRALRRVGLAVGVVVLQGVLPWVLAVQWPAFAGWLTRSGKPLVFAEGISIWPTEAIRLLTLLLCLYLVFRGWSALVRNLDEISLGLRLGKTRRRLTAEQREEDRSLQWWQRLVNMFCFRFLAPTPYKAAVRPEMSQHATNFWKRYIVQNRTWARFVRTAACVLLMMAFGYFLMRALGERPLVPQRGELSTSVHTALILPTVLAMYFLMFSVADATLLCVLFVRDLRSRLANWPERTLQYFERRLALPRTCLEHWIDLQFVAQRTRCVGGLVYYPFVVLSLVLVSRSSFFDDWHLPLSALLLAVLIALIVVACAVALQRGAEASRRLALKAVDDALMLASRGPQGPAQASPDQLKLLRRWIEDLHEGAFAPLLQQPLLKAMLLPFVTLSGAPLADYVALASL